MMASTETSRLANFQKHFEDMRALIHCKICLKPFYEPYTLPCGHTYCYSCLSSWCAGSHSHGKSKTCPDCRAIVGTQPSPNFLLRDLVQMFLTHTELLPEDETVKEHTEGKAAEIAAIAADKAGLGLFKGVFQKKRLPRFPGIPIVDAQDGVERCPSCTWELEEGECRHCGWFIEMEEDVSLGSYNSDEDDRDLSPIHRLEQRIIQRPNIHIGGRIFEPYNHHLGFHRDIDDFSDGDDDDYLSPAPDSVAGEEDESQSGDESGDGDEMNSFISNDEDDDLPDEVDNDDQSVSTIHGHNATSSTRQYSTDGDLTSNLDGASQESPPPRQFFGIDLTGGSDDDHSLNDDSTIISNPAEATTENSETGDDDVSEQQTDYDTDSSVREISLPPPIVARVPGLNRAKRRRVILDDEDEETSEESDDTAIRPAHAQLRRQRDQRANTNHSPPRPLRRQILLMPSEDDVPRSRARRGRSWRSEGANAMPIARRGRMGTTRVH